jgi:hypothetical protein
VVFPAFLKPAMPKTFIGCHSLYSQLSVTNRKP